MKKFLNGKDVLFFSVKTFDLEKQIQVKLKELGANVVYYDERPNNKKVTKAIIRVYRQVYQNQIDRYYRQIMDSIKDKNFDYLFVNRAEVMPSFFLEWFVNNFPNCKRIFYTWDSFKNHKNSLQVLDYFHEKFSFDCDDCENHNLKLRPLFFLDSFKNLKNKSNPKYELLFMGTTHSDRYLVTKKIEKWCKQNDFSCFTFFYIQGFWVYLYKKLLDKSFKKARLADMNFKGLSSDEMIDFYAKSKVVLDINHPGQSGLTMRTFEAIGAQKKLITTNQNIKKYNFYNEKNILVLDRDEMNIDKEFFKEPYKAIDENIYEKLSLTGWLESIFRDNNDSFSWLN